MKYLITGGNGQLGNAFRKILPKGEAVFTDVEELDVTNKEAIKEMVREVKPEFILHCAALTNVDGCETNQELADKINHKSAEYFSEACKDTGATLIYVSTDYVFPGDGKEPYFADAATGPRSVYGKTKLLGEEAAKNTEKYYIFRTSWVYGDGHNFVRTMIKLSETMEELKIVNDQVGRPTYAEDLAAVIKEATEKGIPFGVYHVQNKGEAISWADFAKKIFEITGKKTKVIPISTEEYLEMSAGKTIAPRPNYSVLDISKIEAEGIVIPEWERSLNSYLQENN